MSRHHHESMRDDRSSSDSSLDNIPPLMKPDTEVDYNSSSSDDNMPPLINNNKAYKHIDHDSSSSDDVDSMPPLRYKQNNDDSSSSSDENMLGGSSSDSSLDNIPPLMKPDTEVDYNSSSSDDNVPPLINNNKAYKHIDHDSSSSGDVDSMPPLRYKQDNDDSSSSSDENMPGGSSSDSSLDDMPPLMKPDTEVDYNSSSSDDNVPPSIKNASMQIDYDSSSSYDDMPPLRYKRDNGWSSSDDDDDDDDKDKDNNNALLQEEIDAQQQQSDHDDDVYPGVEEFKQRMKQKGYKKKKKQQRSYKKDDDDDSDDDSSVDDEKSKFVRGSYDPYHTMREELLDQLIHGEDAPTKRDVGVFLTKEELETWRQNFAKIIPERNFDYMYGKDRGPHGFGTKIRLPQVHPPLKGTILGSRFYNEGQIRNERWDEPYYIVLCKNGEGWPEKLSLMDAHEEWVKGWGKTVDNDGNDDGDDSDEELLDWISLESSSVDGDNDNMSESPYPDTYEQQMNKYEDWNLNLYGTVDEQFWIRTFTEEELKQCRRGNIVVVSSKSNNSSGSSPSSSAFCNLEDRKFLMNIVLAWTRDKVGGVIIECERGTKYLAIEFNGSYFFEGKPIIDVDLGISYEKEPAEIFLRGEDIITFQCSSRTMSAIQDNFLASCAAKGLNDMGSGLLLFQGHLSPIPPTVETVRALMDLPAPKCFCTLKEVTFGIEFELSCVIGTWNSKVAYQISNLAHAKVNNLMDKQMHHPLYIIGILDIEDRASPDEWKIVRDGSLQGSPDYPNSNKFEFVSPILEGETGLHECNRVLDVLNDVTAILLNKSMAMHVHIGVQDFSLENLRKVCSNFIVFEDIIDMFMPASRRNNKYCKSIKKALEIHGSTKDMYKMVQSCKSSDDLFELVNPKGRRYFKLNVQNLRTKKRPTLEFRQHPATTNYERVEPWVRFCTAFVHNSANYSPSHLVLGDEVSEGGDCRFDELFDKLIGDPALKKYYKIRCEEIVHGDDTVEIESDAAMDCAPLFKDGPNRGPNPLKSCY